MPLQAQIKTCSNCMAAKDVAEFHIYKTATSSGIRGKCKECTRAENRLSYESNIEERRSKNRQYVKSHQEERNRYAQKYYQKNIERQRKYNRDNYRKNEERLRAARMRYEYGLSFEDYKLMFDAQEGLCAICKDVCKTGNRLCVDHNHDTGEVRGLLCRTCNTALGFFADNKDLIEGALKYLKHHEERM